MHWSLWMHYAAFSVHVYTCAREWGLGGRSDCPPICIHRLPLFANLMQWSNVYFLIGDHTIVKHVLHRNIIISNIADIRGEQRHHVANPKPRERKFTSKCAHFFARVARACVLYLVCICIEMRFCSSCLHAIRFIADSKLLRPRHPIMIASSS